MVKDKTTEEVIGLLAKTGRKSPEHLKKYHFPKGVSGNPGGKILGTRNTLTGNFVRALSADFDKHGEKTISRARNADPLGYVKVIAAMLPKQLERVAPLEELSDAELSAGIALLRSKLSVTSRSTEKVGTGIRASQDIITVS